MIAHGVQMGEHVILAAQVGIAGSSKLGRGVVLAGQVGVAGHIEIGDRARATAQTGIPNSVDARRARVGLSRHRQSEWLKAVAVFRTLPELKRRLADLGGPAGGARKEDRAIIAECPIAARRA